MKLNLHRPGGLFASRNYANVTSTLALVVALGGTGFAATSLAHNSVGTPQLKDRAVTTAKLHRSAVTASKVKTHSLLAEDFKAGQVSSALAYAHVNADGTVVAADSKGITSANVKSEAPGVYCFTGLTFPVHTAVATEDYFATTGVGGVALFGKGNSEADCSQAHVQAEVATVDTGAFAATGFYIVFY